MLEKSKYSDDVLQDKVLKYGRNSAVGCLGWQCHKGKLFVAKMYESVFSTKTECNKLNTAVKVPKEMSLI